MTKRDAVPKTFILKAARRSTQGARVLRFKFSRVVALLVILMTISFVALGQELKNPSPIALLSDVYFEDGFEGDSLANHWDVTNPDPDQFIVEDGTLLVIGKAVGGFTNAETPNLIRLKRELPRGDWVATVKLSAEFQTTRDLFEFGLYTGPDNFVAARLWGTCCYSSRGLYVETKKISGGKTTNFSNRAWGPGSENYQEFANTIPQPITLKLIKNGRTYRSAIHLEGQKTEAGEPVWIETDLVSSLRAPKQIVMNASQWKEVSGESLFMIDSIKIETNEE